MLELPCASTLLLTSFSRSTFHTGAGSAACTNRH